MTQSKEYHLPNNSYWVCNSKYNGLSQLAKYLPASERVLAKHTQIGILTNRSISTRIAKQLAVLN